MSSIFNAKTAIAACLAVTVVTLSSFTRSSNPALLGSSQSANIRLSEAPQTADPGAPTTYIVPTVYVVPAPYTRLITATRFITLTDTETYTATATIIPEIPIQGMLSYNQKMHSKLSNLD
jgi:hypothetical protein